MAIEIGDVVGDYKVTAVLGRGGMGKVFRVRSLLTDREEAMKVVLADLSGDPSFADRFLREIKVHASLQHPNIAALYSAHRIDDRLVMILELVEGVSLEDLLRPEGMDIGQASNYVQQVLQALAYAHERGVVHRDIKPANVLIAWNGMVKLTDFGIARSTTEAQLTGTGLAIGTMAYMSPEQIAAGPVDARSDIYSLGLTFYEMVTGRRAVQRDTEPERMYAQLTLMPPPPETVNPRVPPGLAAVIMRAIAKQPEARFQNAREFLAALGHPEASAPAPAQTPAPTQVSPPSQPMPRAAVIDPRELAELETRLSRVVGPIARHMVAQAAGRYHSVDEIQQALSAQLDTPNERELFTKTTPVKPPTHASGPTPGAISPNSPTKTPAPSSFDPATLDRLAQALAPFLGPIAKVVVNRAARNARGIEELRCTVAADIDSNAERQRFLEATRGIE